MRGDDVFAILDKLLQVEQLPAAVGDASARAITYRTRQKAAYYYEHSGWKRLFVGGYKFELEPGLLNLDGYAQFFLYATLTIGGDGPPAKAFGIDNIRINIEIRTYPLNMAPPPLIVGGYFSMGKRTCRPKEP